MKIQNEDWEGHVLPEKNVIVGGLRTSGSLF